MFQKLLARIGETFGRRGLPYMVIGGQAVLLYGEPRLTRDIDITLGLGADRIDEILYIAEELSLRPIPKDIKDFVRQTMVLPSIDDVTGIRVDFVFSFTPYEMEAIGRARKIVINGQGVRFASPEDLIIHKIFAGRLRDIEDVRTVLLKNSGIDIPYIKNWLKEFDSASDEKNFLKTFEGILG
ncbi:MAG: nucleotidyltransferase [Deltaproteobacteria bacterium]|nr:nucleotidyltransferase [Deltaproteobacteria bacterium]